MERLVQRHRLVGSVAGVAVLLVLAAPFLGVRFGFPDAGNDRAGTSTRQAYDMLAEGFGPGANGPLLLVSERRRRRPGRSCGCRALAATPGVAAVTPPQARPAGDTAVMTVRADHRPAGRRAPRPGPPARHVLPAAVAGTGIRARRRGDRGGDRQHREHRPAASRC